MANIAWHLFNFRRGLARQFSESGYDVILVASADGYEGPLEAEGWHFVSLQNLSRTGINPLREPMLLREFIRIYKDERLDLVLHYTSKPNIWGNLAAAHCNIPSISTINGRGGPFSGSRRITAKIAMFLYQWSLRHCSAVLFHNSDDRAFFIENRMVAQSKTGVVRGSGVNLEDFDPTALPARPTNPKTVFFMYSRLSSTKGVREYMEAAGEMIADGAPAEFLLAGPLDTDELAISRDEIQGWEDRAVVRYLGVSDAIQEEISLADCIVYPSYYMEGLPRALLEASAMAKPMITTDHVGCRDVVRHGKNGLLVTPRDPASLKKAMVNFMDMDTETRNRMGRRARAIAEAEFDERLVNRAYIDLADKATLGASDR